MNYRRGRERIRENLLEGTSIDSHKQSYGPGAPSPEEVRGQRILKGGPERKLKRDSLGGCHALESNDEPFVMAKGKEIPVGEKFLDVVGILFPRIMNCPGVVDNADYYKWQDSYRGQYVPYHGAARQEAREALHAISDWPLLQQKYGEGFYYKEFPGVLKETRKTLKGILKVFLSAVEVRGKCQRAEKKSRSILKKFSYSQCKNIKGYIFLGLENLPPRRFPDRSLMIAECPSARIEQEDVIFIPKESPDRKASYGSYRLIETDYTLPTDNRKKRRYHGFYQNHKEAINKMRAVQHRQYGENGQWRICVRCGKQSKATGVKEINGLAYCRKCKKK